jgi:hypothetical protein
MNKLGGVSLEHQILTKFSQNKPNFKSENYVV